jgi:hypothetical protein
MAQEYNGISEQRYSGKTAQLYNWKTEERGDLNLDTKTPRLQDFKTVR